MENRRRKTFVYAGNWTVQSEDRESGIGIYEYCEEDGSLKHVETVYQDITPAIIKVDGRRNILYAADEKQNSPAFGMQGGGGRVFAFRIDPETGKLTKHGDEQPSFGSLASYVEEDPEGKWLVVTNHGDDDAVTKAVRDDDGSYRVITEYSDVTAALYPLAEDGRILPACDLVRFEPDRSRIPARTACLHAVWFVPGGDFCIVTNMKQDQVVMMRLDREKGTLTVCDRLKCPAGTWPRYGVFHRDKKLFYLNCEKALVFHVIEYDSNGKMKLLKTVDTAPKLFCAEEGKRISQSDLIMSRDGRCLYNFYRYTDSAAVFRLDDRTGMPKMIQSLALEGMRPRGAAISPDGRFLLIANITGTIVTMKIREDGTLIRTETVDRSMKYPGNVAFYRPQI